MASWSRRVPPQINRVLRLGLNLLPWIVSPSAGAGEKQRRYLKLLSAFLLLIAINTLIGMAVMKNAGHSSWVVMLGTASLLSLGYVLSRTVHYRLATVIAISIPAVPIIAMVLFSPNREDIPNQLPWLALPLLVCSLLLSLRHTVVIAICYVLLIVVLIPFMNLPIARIAELLAFMFVIIFFVVAVTAARQREQSEIEHQLAERKQAEKALRESEEKFAKAFRASPNVISITSLEDDRHVEINESFTRFTGYSREEVIGHSPKELDLWVKPTEKNRMMDVLDKEGRAYNHEFSSRHKSGEIRFGLGSAEVIKIGGKPHRIVVITDITERKRAEEALQRSEENFRHSLDDSPVGIRIINTSEDTLYVNRALLDMYGYDSSDEFLSTPVEKRFTPEGYKEHLKVLKRKASGKPGPQYSETSIVRKNGEIRYVQTLRKEVLWNGEKQSQMLYQDITERKQAEENLKKTLADLEQSSARLAATNKELETFSYSVSHDLRSPLRSIDGFSQALLEDYGDKLDKKGQDYLNRLRGASQKMGELIDGLLKLSRLTRAEMHEESVDLSALAEEIAARLQETQRERQAKFIIGKQLTARGDTQLLRVLLENLLGNAWKFTGRTPHAKIEFGATRNNGKKTYFVKDNGVGFDMTYIDKLFGAFQRLHDSNEFPGTGIGLATVQRIINRHGGTIRVEGAPGKGATFYFTLD